MPGLLRPIISKTVKHLYGLFFKPEYRQYHLLPMKLFFYSRYRRFNTNIFGLDICAPDKLSFLFQIEDIFVKKTL